MRERERERLGIKGVKLGSEEQSVWEFYSSRKSVSGHGLETQGTEGRLTK